MKTYPRNLVVFLLIATVSRASAQQLPPIQVLGPVLNTSTEPLRSASQVRALSGGRIILNDNTGRRVLMFDSTLTPIVVIADTTSATARAYASRLGGLIAYRGDSTLFVDPSTLSMMVVDPHGKIARTMAVPRPDDVQMLIGGPFGTPGFDAAGRLVYRSSIRRTIGDGGALAPAPDSALIVRLDLDRRALDTLVKFGIPRITMNTIRNENGSMLMTTIVNPMPLTDDFAILSDGTIAVVRGREYRVDFFTADGHRRAGSKIPFDWQRLSDDDKVMVIDSTRTALEKQRSAQAAGSSTPTAGDSSKRQRAGQDGGGSASVGFGTFGGGGGSASASFTMPPLQLVSPSELPDYRPAFRQGAARGDADGNLWIRTTKVVSGGTVYDVVDNQGQLRKRVQLPAGRVIAGFAPGGVVYMGVVDGPITRLERARLK